MVRTSRNLMLNSSILLTAFKDDSFYEQCPDFAKYVEVKSLLAANARSCGSCLWKSLVKGPLAGIMGLIYSKVSENRCGDLFDYFEQQYKLPFSRILVMRKGPDGHKTLEAKREHNPSPVRGSV